MPVPIWKGPVVWDSPTRYVPSRHAPTSRLFHDFPRRPKPFHTRRCRENPLCGSERIQGELLTLGIVVSNPSIRRYRWLAPPRAPRQVWRTFLRNHAHAIGAAVWDGRTSRVPRRWAVGHACVVRDLLLVVLAALRAACRRRGDLVLENLLLRHQFAVLTRPTRQRRRGGFRRLDKALWVLAVGAHPPDAPRLAPAPGRGHAGHGGALALRRLARGTTGSFQHWAGVSSPQPRW